MKAIILAAGIGSRLRPLTENKPKSMVGVAGKPILKHQIDAYIKAGVTDIGVVVGYCGESIREYLMHEKNVNIHFFENKEYENTNNMYSLWLAKDFVKRESFYLSNADVVFSDNILALNKNDESMIFVDKGVYNDESMKVSLNASNRINHISKKVVREFSYAASIDVYRFNKEDGEILLNHVEELIVEKKKLKDWTEVALNNLFEEGRINPVPVDIESRKWVEIDNYDDLAEADKLFSDFDFTLQKYDNFIFDMDGTLFVGDTPLESAISQVNALYKLNKNIYFITNNSSKNKKDYVHKMAKMGLNVLEEQIISSADSTIAYLKNNKVEDVYVLGTRSLIESVEKAGINTKGCNPEYVVIGYDTELTYEKLKEACKYINSGVDFIATHLDVFCPTLSGPIPDCGTIVKMLEMTTGKKVSYISGKPRAEMFDFLEFNSERTVIVGDRLHTDGLLAKNVNADFILVLTGESTRSSVNEKNIIPIKLCLKDFGDLLI